MLVHRTFSRITQSLDLYNSILQIKPESNVKYLFKTAWKLEKK